MEIIYNCFAGISGDMNLAAMLDLGMDIKILLSELSKLGIDNEFELKAYPAEKNGINGTRVDVLLKEYKHHHKTEHHHHNHHHTHHNSRNYTDIENLINNSSLATEIKTLAKKIFWEVALAEGKVHNKKAKDVHFHEVGATDSIIDIVGAAICYYHMKITYVISTIPELGGGFVNCAHGKMPVPAPATVEILHGIECNTGAVDKEMTTPTGAAILKVLTNEWIANPSLKITKIAYGIGHRTVDIPNVLRVYKSKSDTKIQHNSSIMIECNIDDMTAEDLALVPDILLSEGANDAFLTPIIMKKGRTAIKLSILCDKENADALCDLIFLHTSTIGLRRYNVDKLELARQIKIINTDYGEVHYKESTLPNGKKRCKPELDDLLAMAKKNNISIEEIRKILKLA